MDESHFKTLQEISRNGRISQRELSRKVGLSLGRINYIIHALIKSGYVKATRFRNSRKKLAYAYVLTPRGVRKRVDLLRTFLDEKRKEHDRIVREIEELKEAVTELDRARAQLKK